MKLEGRKIYKGIAEAEAIVTKDGISFYGGVDPDTGVVVEVGHDLEGQSITGKVLVFPTGKGSTVGSYTMYRMKKNNMAPAAIVNEEIDTIIAVGCIISEIPCVDKIDINRIKHDYIERQYKQIKPDNPLEYTYDPEETPVTVERPKHHNGNFIKIDDPFKAYIFLVKPKTIFSLFEEFGFRLFFKNVRNPIINSEINQQIEKTLIDNPAYFWYYNNGITAIADNLQFTYGDKLVWFKITKEMIMS